MKIRLLLALAGLAFSFVFPILAQEQRTVDPQDRQQIEAVFMKLQEAYNKRDVAAIKALYTWDAVEVRSWAGVYSGRPAIEEMFKADFASDPAKMVNKIVQLFAIGDAICEIADSEVGDWKAPTLVIYVRDGDAWKRRVVYVDKRPTHGLMPLIQDSGNSDHR